MRKRVTTATGCPASSEHWYLHLDFQVVTPNSDAKPHGSPALHSSPSTAHRTTLHSGTHTYGMSGFQDVRDVMDITGPVEGLPRPPPAKKQKTVEKRPGVASPPTQVLLAVELC